MDVDIDELLDMDTDEDRRNFLQVSITIGNNNTVRTTVLIVNIALIDNFYLFQELLVDAKKPQLDVKVTFDVFSFEKKKKLLKAMLTIYFTFCVCRSSSTISWKRRRPFKSANFFPVEKGNCGPRIAHLLRRLCRGH